MRPAVFLDRDGTVIEHVHHLHRLEDVRLERGAAAAIASLRRAGYLAVLATNQSVVGRGLLSSEGLDAIHASMLEALAREDSDARLDAIYWNPHTPPEGDSEPHPDRKPGPGMLLRAAVEHGIDLASSWMVGDSVSDVLAGQRAGCGGSILVRTGLGRQVVTAAVPGTILATDLGEAARLILESGQHGGSTAAARR